MRSTYPQAIDSLVAVEAEVVACRACPRLVAWREQVARDKRASFRQETYWGRPVPSFGDPAAALLVVGLVGSLTVERLAPIATATARTAADISSALGAPHTQEVANRAHISHR